MLKQPAATRGSSAGGQQGGGGLQTPVPPHNGGTSNNNAAATTDHQQHHASKFASTPGAVTALRVNYASTDRAFTHSPASTDPRLLAIRREVRSIASGPALGDKPTWDTGVHTPGSDLPQRAPRASNSAFQGTKLDYNFRASTLPPVNQFIYVPKANKLKVDESVFLTAAERARIVKTCVTTNVALSRREFSNNLSSGAAGSVDPLKEAFGENAMNKGLGSDSIDYFTKTGAGQKGLFTDIATTRWNASTLPTGTDIMKAARCVPPPVVYASDTTTPASFTMYTDRNKNRNATLLGLAPPSSVQSKQQTLQQQVDDANNAPPLSSSVSSVDGGQQHPLRSRRSSAGRASTVSAGGGGAAHRAGIEEPMTENNCRRHHTGCAYISPSQRQVMLVDSLRQRKLEDRQLQVVDGGNGVNGSLLVSSTTNQHGGPSLTMKNRHEWVGQCPVDVAGARAQIAASQLNVPFGGTSSSSMPSTYGEGAAAATAMSAPLAPGSLGRVKRNVKYTRTAGGRNPHPPIAKHGGGGASSDSDDHDSDADYVLEDAPLHHHSQ